MMRKLSYLELGLARLLRQFLRLELLKLHRLSRHDGDMISRGAESKAIAVSFVGACWLGLNARRRRHEP